VCYKNVFNAIKLKRCEVKEYVILYNSLDIDLFVVINKTACLELRY